MRPIPDSLRAHQRGPDRLPHVRAVVLAERWGVPLLPWERLYEGDERDCPHALALAAGGAVIRARNDGGALAVSRVPEPGGDAAWDAWTALGKAEPGTGVALAAHGSEVLLLYVASGGRALTLRRSSDGGVTWEAARTLVRESTAIEWVALAMRASNGDACAFYVQGTDTLKRLRRRAGTWDAAGSNWIRGGAVAALTGVAAMHDSGDYRLIVSGRARPSGRKQVWSTFLGDGGFPVDFWAGLSVIAESDASSAREFGGPGVFEPGGLDQRACFAARDAGGEPGSRVYTSHPPARISGNPDGWSEPEPHEATSAYGLAVATGADGTVWGSTRDGVWRARLGRSLDVSDHIVEASWRLAPFATRARLVLDDSGGRLPDLAPGRTVEIAPGYRSGAGGGAEYGASVHAVIDDVTRESGAGQARVVLECSGHWERLAAWRPSQVWQSAAGEHSRERLFWRLCASAGIRVSGQGGEDWSGSRPAFAVSPGESGLAAARRLLGTSRVTVRSRGDGLAVAEPGAEAVEGFGGGGHPLERVALGDGAPATNWVRAQGDAVDADAHDFASIYRDGQRLRLVRSLDAGTGAQALARAAASLERNRHEQHAGVLVAPFHPGLELFDPITVTDERLGLRKRPYRVVELGMEYNRRPGRRPRFDSIVGLGEMD